ncbi:MAG: hypothetical protein WEA11_05650 [Acidimicrobiales bacterium]
MTTNGSRTNHDSAVRIVSLYPDLLGTYGDGGNALVFIRRLEWRGIAVDHVIVEAGEEVPDSADLYLVGGGEDGPQVQAAKELERSKGVHRAVDKGAVVLAVCAGMQILGHHFPDASGATQTGLGLLDCETIHVDRPRAVGELLTANARLVRGASSLDLGPLTGFENHAGRTLPGPNSLALASVEIGEGNGGGTEGVITGTVVGTYLHGPALARNPKLADGLLSWIVGTSALTTLDDSDIEILRSERIRAAREHELAPRRSWRDVLKRS